MTRVHRWETFDLTRKIVVKDFYQSPFVAPVAAVADAVVDAAGRNDGDAGVTESHNSRNLAPILTFYFQNLKTKATV